jgi:hypothetical protein
MRPRSLRLVLATAAILAAGSLAAAPASAKTFAATPGTLGAIPDGLSGNCSSPTPGAPKIVTFPVKGLKDTITSVQAKITFGAHPWAGDITAVLIAPNSASQTLFARTGSLTGSLCGDSSDLAGPYTFSDAAATSWWTTATSTGAAAIPSGVYRSSGLGGPSVASAPADTLITPAFTGVKPNGMWFIAVNDSINGDAGSISAASITITAKDTIPPQTTFRKTPKKRTTSRAAVFGFKSNETGRRYRCKLDHKPWRDCTPTMNFVVGTGAHKVRVSAVDQAGNKDATPAVFSWTVVAG